MPNMWEARTIEAMGLVYKQSLTLTIGLASCVGTLLAIATVSLAICSYACLSTEMYFWSLSRNEATQRCTAT